MSSKRLAVSGIIGALAFLLTFIEFPIFPFAAFLRFDPSISLIVVMVQAFGWIPALFSLLIKDLLFTLIHQGAGGPIGMLMNTTAGLVFVSILSLLKTRTAKYIGYSLSSLAASLVMLIMNFLFLPLYTGMSFSDAGSALGVGTSGLILTIIGFNIIKFLANSFIGDIAYSRIKKIFNNKDLKGGSK